MTTYLEDLAEGQKIETERRVVSAADIDAFCELSGDHNPLHTDDERARAAGFAGRIAHGLLVLSIGLSLGGTTGYAINPARDLGPRIAHAILPVPNKRDSDWGYAWIPAVGPILGGLLAAGAFAAIT